jgi:hypothetical protein
MSILGSSTSKKTAAATDIQMLTPEQVVEQLRVLRQQIPEFVQLPKNRELRQIRSMLSKLDPEFAHEAIHAVGASDIVQNAIGNTPDELHQAEDEVARWSAVESELRSMLRGVSTANLMRRKRLGLAALQAFNVSRQLVRQEDHAHLLPHVESMTRIRKLGRRRSKAPTEPQPQAPPQTTSP